jgi:SAM-dependent methyltransferase
MRLVYFIAKQISRVVHRLPRPSHLGVNKSYARVSELLRQGLGDGARVLCVGGVRPSDYRFFLPYFHVICLDLEIKQRVDIVADAHFLPFKEGVFDGAILQAVIQCTKDPGRVVSEVYRGLRAGGLVYGSIPLCQEEAMTPVDYWRWTTEGTRLLFGGFKEIELGIASGPFVALFNIILSIAKNWSKDKDLNFVIWYFLLWLSYPLNLLDILTCKNRRLMAAAAALYYVGQK